MKNAFKLTALALLMLPGCGFRKAIRLLAAALALSVLPGCGEAFTLACDLAGYQIVEVGPRVEPTGSAVVPLPPRPLRPQPGQRPQ